jgi:hypothetical protein
MHILKKWVSFCWDEATQCSFEVFKHALDFSPLLQRPDYNKDFLLYLDVVESTIGMVLVQEDETLEDNFIYCLIQGLVGLEINYSHVEKLSLVAIHSYQQSHHYILLHKTTVIVVVNPFQYVLT